ncbi:MAG: 16S rRNA (adenine(1518)-N(6)/adenine(1519)-N(6))-dimethyltransferase RsmA [Nitrososphaerota archaeon]|nr:16S rRNA (adenine(1518)-N(6)/adenine(1519)-N(6))-dimethyltransferase RsmA [Candidatus Bathyarchaeota archaeon]MDW8023811.1 16S rRNA (adenine(1518)-N(6)/adenine(1519)-N(6))-dimethyltransferase RsmA [Nitrososphaerota archaeon]
MSLLEETKRILRRHRIFPKKRLGQHFTVFNPLFQRLAECATLTSNDIVLDVGAGLGFLTRFLASKCRKVLAVEVDPRLVKVLLENLKNLSNVEVVEGDVLKTPISQFNKVVSIPPYNISSDLLLWLYEREFACAVLVFQKEFVNRIVAPVGSENYGWLTVLAYYQFEIELFGDVPRWMFYPQPKVDSIIVRLNPKSTPPFPLENKAFFKQLVQALFTQRNRKVRNAIKPFLDKYSKTVGSSVPPVDSLPFHDRRVRDLAPEDFGELSNVLLS